MVVDQATLATLKVAAQQVWELKQKAEQDAKETREAKLVETLKEKWLRMNSKIHAVELLLADEAEVLASFDESQPFPESCERIGAAA